MLTGQLLLQLAIILVIVQIVGFLGRQVGQQWVIGEILAGLALGPSLFGILLPGMQHLLFSASAFPTLQTLGDMGLVLYMIALGARLDTHLILRQSRTAIISSISGILLPSGIGAVLTFFLFPRSGGPSATVTSFMLMLATAMAFTAFPVLARFLTEKKMLGTSIGTLALTCAAVDDVIAWLLLALVIAIIHANDLVSIAATLFLTLLFIACMLAVVRPLLLAVDRRICWKERRIAISIILLVLAACFTNAIGIHPIVGAFLMGIILPRNVLFTGLIDSIDLINAVLFLPLFFVYSGLRTRVGLIGTPWRWLKCLLVLTVACRGKIFGGMSAMRLLKESWRDALSLGALMNTRGLVELIVLTIGLDLHVRSTSLFAMLVIMALVTTMVASPLLPLPGYRQRTAQEAQEKIGFLVESQA